MTIFTSQMISGAVGQQMNMFAGYSGHAQQIGGGGGYQQPMMPQMGVRQAATRGMGGMYGEQGAMRMANIGQTAMGVGAAGLGMLGAFSPIPLDPFSGAMMGARMGLGGAAMGAVGGAMMGAPIFAAAQAAQVYGGAFTGGMQDQAALNSTMRNNFSQFGGQGAMGRGFSQQQMGQVGSMISGELRKNPMSNAGEMNQLISGGADAGMLSAVRDVQQFTQKFKTMLNTLKDVQRELGGTLTDALQFVRGSQQAGIFKQADQTNFAAEVRGAEAVTGMDRQQLIALSAQGAHIARAFGGVGKQGAMGALRGAQTLGAAVQAGVVNQEMLSEATGGLQGAEAIGAWTSNMLARSGRFSKTGMGRFSLFALSNSEGSGLDADMLSRFNAGDLSTGDVRKAARGNVRGMGRARALNSEGRLRGAVMEEGGMASQIGMMRLMVGDRVLDQGDDMGSLVMQRRFGMDRPQAELMMNLMRNQSTIAQQEAVTSMGAKRSQDLSTDITENRSVDSFMRHIEHGLSDMSGVTKAREMGRTFLTKLSSMTEKAMNDMLGVSASAMSQSDHQSLNRVVLGRGSADDIANVGDGSGMAAGGGSANLFGRGLFQSGPSAGDVMSMRGVGGIRGMTQARAFEVQSTMELARQGLVTGTDRESLGELNRDASGTTSRILSAQLAASSTKRGAADFYRQMGAGTSANAVDAFMAQNEMSNPGAMLSRGSLMNRGGGEITAGMVGRDLFRAAGAIAGVPTAGFATAGVAGILGLSGHGMGSEVMGAMNGPGDPGLDYIMKGGHLAGRLFNEGAAERETSSSDLYRALTGTGETKAFTEEDMSAALSGEGTATALRRMGGMSGNREELLGEINAMEIGASKLSGGQAMAMASATAQMRENVNRTGGIGTEFSGRGRSSAREIEMRQERARSAGNMSSLQNLLTESGSGDLAALFGTEAGLLGGRGSGQDISNAGYNIQSHLAGMDRNSEEYRSASRVLGSNETGRGFLAGAAQQRQLERDISGQGRRGSRGANEAAFGLITGNSLSGMEFTTGGKTIKGSGRGASQQLARLLAGGGQGQSDVMAQLQAQMEGRGVGSTDAAEMVGALTAGLGASGGRGVQGAPMDQLIRAGSTNADLQRVRQEGINQVQKDRDPLGFERNEILKRMEAAMSSINDKTGTGGMSGGEPSPT